MAEEARDLYGARRLGGGRFVATRTPLEEAFKVETSREPNFNMEPTPLSPVVCAYVLVRSKKT